METGLNGYLTEIEMSHFIKYYQHLTTQDLIAIIQRLDMVCANMVVFGLRPSIFRDGHFGIVSLMKSTVMSDAFMEDILTRAGLYGDSWSSIQPDRKVLSYIEGQRYEDAGSSITNMDASFFKTSLKAIVDSYDIDIGKHFYKLLFDLVNYQGEGLAESTMTPGEKDNLAHSFTSRLADDIHVLFLKLFRGKIC